MWRWQSLVASRCDSFRFCFRICSGFVSVCLEGWCMVFVSVCLEGWCMVFFPVRDFPWCQWDLWSHWGGFVASNRRVFKSWTTIRRCKLAKFGSVPGGILFKEGFVQDECVTLHWKRGECQKNEGGTVQTDLALCYGLQSWKREASHCRALRRDVASSLQRSICALVLVLGALWSAQFQWFLSWSHDSFRNLNMLRFHFRMGIFA